jgi:hypothetical protein
VSGSIEPLMTQPGSIVQDRYVDVSDAAMKAHEAYWTSSSVHKEFGKAW